MIKIYLAGKTQELKKITQYANILRSKGATITRAWFEKEDETTSETEIAIEDTRGVREAETCIFIFENKLPYAGAFTELGMAMALNKRVIIVGNGANNNVFIHFPLNEHVDTFEDALKLLDLSSALNTTFTIGDLRVVTKKEELFVK